MLSNKSVEMAQMIVSNECACVTPRPNSILEEAVVNSAPILQTEAPSLESFAQDMIVASAREADGYDMHDAAITDVVATVGPALVRQIKYVREVVVPFISETSATLMDKVQEAEPLEYEIVPVGLGDLTTLPVVSELFGKMTSTMTFPRLIKEGAAKTDAELINCLRTGLPDLDDAMAATIAKYGTQRVVEMYDAFFRGVFNQANDETSRAIYNMVVKSGDGYRISLTNPGFTDLAIVGYFLIDTFLDNVIPGTGMSLDQYKNTINGMKLSLGQQINFVVKNFTDDVQRQRLVIRWADQRGIVTDANKARILVNEIVYSNALAQGITPEVIIGGMMDPRGAKLDLPSFIANAKFYQGLWERLDKSRTDHVEKGFFTRLKTIIGPVVEQKLQALPNDYLPDGFDRTAKVTAIINNLNTTGLNAYGDWDMDGVPNLFYLVKNIATVGIFNFIDTRSIIDIIEADIESGEDKPEYAAYRAAVVYLAKWLVGQFDIAP
ncbi:hypothetical protein TOTORO_02170 [Serratia phage vB_SmaS-Totoro]|nr:hypothetical protein TOTORO_02170 [Serratia phage vB_SmaS-Totoro]